MSTPFSIADRAPRPCYSCDTGTVAPRDIGGRRIAYRGLVELEIPGPFVVLACDQCSDWYSTAGVSEALDARLEPLYREALARLRHWIVIVPDRCGGRPTVRGTRIEPRRVGELADLGVSREVLLDDHPSLTSESLDAALLWWRIRPEHRPAPGVESAASSPAS